MSSHLRHPVDGSVIILTVLLVLLCGCTTTSATTDTAGGGSSFVSDVGDLADRADAEIGVAYLDLRSGRAESVNGDRRFPLLSVFKVYAAARLLAMSTSDPDILDESVPITASDIVENSPVTRTRRGGRMSFHELARAALQNSDNTAGNLILRRIGGPAAVTATARAVGDRTTTLDHVEPCLNDALPGDTADVTTATGLASGLHAILAGGYLTSARRQELRDIMAGTQTSAARFRASLPGGWTTADKTGSGHHPSSNDVGLLIGPRGQLRILVVLTHSRRPDPDSTARNSVIASVAAIAAGQP